MTKKLNIPANVNVRDIAFDKQGTVWLATDRAGGFAGDKGYLLPAQPGFWGGL